MIGLTIEGADAIILDFKEYPGRVTRALPRALNRAINSGKTVEVREISRDTGLKASDVRDAIRVTEATVNRPEARLAVSLKRRPLIQFNARGPEPSRGRGRGVSYRLPGGKGRIPNAFLATMGSGHRGVFARKGKARLGIRELFGPSLGHVFAKFRSLALARAQEVFQKNFDHEMQFEGTRSAPGTD